MSFSTDDEYDYQHLRSIEKILESDESSSDSETSGKYRLITKRIDSSRIRHKIETFEINTCKCKNVVFPVDGNIRSGAIIYTHSGDKTYFCMGIDSMFGDLTDFAGGVKKTDPSVISGGLRELEEESLGIFGKLNETNVANSLAFYTNNMLVMFIKLDVDMDQIHKKFVSAFSGNTSGKDLEVSGIVWLEKEEFLNSISCKGRRMYSRVRKILNRVVEIIAAL